MSLDEFRKRSRADEASEEFGLVRPTVAGSEPVSIVIPSLDDRELLSQHLPRLQGEVDRRGGADEILVVDDTGKGTLAAWLATRFPDVRALARGDNGGFARALFDGVESAAHDLVFAMNPDILVHPHFLEPLVDLLADPEVHSAVPRILLFGKEDEVESLTEISVDHEIAYVRQRGFEGEDLGYQARMMRNAELQKEWADQ